jgi:hypothetical protein
MPSDRIRIVRRKRRSAIVPGLVLGASFVAVVPAIACSGPGTDPITNMRNIQYGVAAVAYCCFEGGGVAMIGFDAEAGKDASSEADAPDAPADAPSDSKEGG